MDSKTHPFWSVIRTVPDFPKAGIAFFDLTPLLLDHVEAVTHEMTRAIPADILAEVDTLVAIEARGFVFASLLAGHLGKGLILLRKKGKLPPPVHQHHYDLEYGSDCLEMYNGISPRKVLLIDDVLATGGTLRAAAQLCEIAGHRVLGTLVLLDLPQLHDALPWPCYRVLEA
ncbi:MAG: adenine phosphoribosyltransferase [Pseudomonadota bacterium]|nr:adenine phosphoribosyltransferase [Pseudomonadota bacterium]